MKFAIDVFLYKNYYKSVFLCEVLLLLKQTRFLIKF